MENFATDFCLFSSKGTWKVREKKTAEFCHSLLYLSFVEQTTVIYFTLEANPFKHHDKPKPNFSLVHPANQAGECFPITVLGITIKRHRSSVPSSLIVFSQESKKINIMRKHSRIYLTFLS